MAYDDFDSNGEKLGSKGFFVTKVSAAIIAVLVVALLVAEGLIIGLVGRPECEVYSPNEITTTKSTTTTSTTTTIIATTVPTTIAATTTTTSTTSTAPATTVVQGPWTSYRMPLNLIPYDYEVSLRPILEPVGPLNQYIFVGSSTVRYTCVDPTNYIILHTRTLTYQLADWTLKKVDGGQTIALNDMFYYDPNEYVIFETGEPCDQGEKYELTVTNFEGDFAADNDGLYRSDYTNSDGEYVVIATSQMESTGARETFPCFDEPSFKATFVIKLWHRTDSNFFSMSNMPETSKRDETIDGNVWTETTFEKTVVMPTYLLAMVVSDFKHVPSNSSRGVQTNVYARPSYVDDGDADYAASIAPRELEFFEDYIGIPYALTKSDQISVPDFSAGAMENWGLVIYRESALMYNENTTSDSSKLGITNVIAHELAHQWFGNLVSCEWWGQLWLNEGFATYFSYLAEASVQPTWKSKERFVYNEMRSAMRQDELTTSRPIIREVDSQADIGLMFDTITYSKGGSILRMVNGFMGEDNFIKGNKNYLLGQQYGVANQDQLFSYWEKYTSHLSLPTELTIIMETWTLQMGFPLVTVIDSEPLTNAFVVSQQYYLRNPDSTPTQTTGSLKYGYKWYIPFMFKRGSNLVKDAELVWLTPDQSLTLTESDFILGNSEANGYYRVNYDRGSWERIAKRLDSEFYTDIPEANRAQLLDDAFALTSSGRLDPVVPIMIANYLRHDSSYVAWLTFYSNIKYYEYMLGRTEVFGTFKNYALELVVPSLYNVYGWEDGPKTDDQLLERRLRGIGIEGACYYEYPDCVNTAVDYFNKWMASPDDWLVMPASYRSDILCAAIRAGDIEEWNFAWERYDAAPAAWKSSIRYGLACSKDPWILNRYLGYILNLDTIQRVDAASALRYIGGEEYGKDIAWAFLVNNWSELSSTFTVATLSSFVNSIVQRFSTDYDLKVLEDFKETTPNLGGLLVTLNAAIETTQANIKWRQDNEENLTQWFYQNVDNVA